MTNFTINKLPKEYLYEIAAKTKAIRKQKKLNQTKMAHMSGVSLASIKRFEQTGQIALESFLMIIYALERIADLNDLLKPQVDMKKIAKLFDK